jgi:hypothetical protein
MVEMGLKAQPVKFKEKKIAMCPQNRNSVTLFYDPSYQRSVLTASM